MRCNAGMVVIMMKIPPTMFDIPCWSVFKMIMIVTMMKIMKKIMMKMKITPKKKFDIPCQSVFITVK